MPQLSIICQQWGQVKHYQGSIIWSRELSCVSAALHLKRMSIHVIRLIINICKAIITIFYWWHTYILVPLYFLTIVSSLLSLKPLNSSQTTLFSFLQNEYYSDTLIKWNSISLYRSKTIRGRWLAYLSFLLCLKTFKSLKLPQGVVSVSK